MEKEKRKLSPKAKRIINIVVDVVVAVILAFALILAISTITSKKKGYDQYTEIFGTAYLAVESGSMEPTFRRGDLIKIKTVKGDDAANLEKDDIITFKTTLRQGGKIVLNTHRIVEVVKENGTVKYRTQGDNKVTNPNPDSDLVTLDQIVGLYKGKAGGIGKVFLFMQTSAGFFVCVVLPTLLIVAYCAVNLVLVIRKEKKKQTEEAVIAKMDEREKLRQELLAEMQANAAEASQSEPGQTETTADEQTETPAPEPVSESENDQQTSETEESAADEEEK